MSTPRISLRSEFGMLAAEAELGKLMAKHDMAQTRLDIAMKLLETDLSVESEADEAFEVLEACKAEIAAFEAMLLANTKAPPVSKAGSRLPRSARA